MKIAFLTPEYPHLKTGNSGGIGTSIKNLAKALLNEGCHVQCWFTAKGRRFLMMMGRYSTNKKCKVKGLSWFLTRKNNQ
jgi:hypothetical protein